MFRLTHVKSNALFQCSIPFLTLQWLHIGKTKICYACLWVLAFHMYIMNVWLDLRKHFEGFSFVTYETSRNETNPRGPPGSPWLTCILLLCSLTINVICSLYFHCSPNSFVFPSLFLGAQPPRNNNGQNVWLHKNWSLVGDAVSGFAGPLRY